MPEWRALSESVLELSRALLAAAEAGAWTDLERMERQRMELLERLFERRPETAEEIRCLTETAAAVKDIDREVMHLVRAERDGAAEELRKLRSGRAGRDAYRAAAED